MGIRDKEEKLKSKKMRESRPPLPDKKNKKLRMEMEIEESTKRISIITIADSSEEDDGATHPEMLSSEIPTISPSTTDFKNTRKKSEVPATRTVFEYFTSVTHPLSMRESMRLRESNMHEESSDNDIPNSQHSMEKQKSLLKGDELVHCMVHPLSMRKSMRLRENNMHEESSDDDIPNSQHSMEKQKSLLKGDELVHSMILEPQQQKKKNADKNTKQTTPKIVSESCTVSESSTTLNVEQSKNTDKNGHPGSQIIIPPSNHQCNVEGCTNISHHHADEVDIYGNSGWRCTDHVQKSCSVQGCRENGFQHLKISDEFGPAGSRCRHHFYTSNKTFDETNPLIVQKEKDDRTNGKNPVTHSASDE